MEERSNNIEEQEQPPMLGSGALLAAERKKQSRTVEEIAEELNLSLSQIRTIELDQSEGLPEPTYVRGYIRAYANLLGLDAEDVLRHYLNKNWQKSANLDEMPRGIGDSDTGDQSIFSAGRVILFLVLSGLLAFFWFSGTLSSLLDGRIGQDISQEASQDTAQNSTDLDSADVDAELADTFDSGADDGAELAGSNSGNGLESGSQIGIEVDAEVGNESSLNDQASAIEGTGVGNPDSDTSGAISNETQIVLNFTETSWVDIRDEQQNRLAYQSYPAGQTLSVSEEGVLVVLIGNAKGVEMTLNGQPYDLSQHTEGVYAKFSVGTPTP